MEDEKPKAFTFEYSGIVKSLMTMCEVSRAHNPEFSPEPGPPSARRCLATWDTGAMVTVISSEVVRDLCLVPTGKTIMYHANGEACVNTYSVNILLPNNVVFSTLRVTEGKLNGTDVLIGMDIISMGDFSVTSSGNKTVLSFQYPSTHRVDYVGGLAI